MIPGATSIGLTVYVIPNILEDGQPDALVFTSERQIETHALRIVQKNRHLLRPHQEVVLNDAGSDPAKIFKAWDLFRMANPRLPNVRWVATVVLP